MNNYKQFEQEITTIHGRIDAKRTAIKELEYELKLLENEAERIANYHEGHKIEPYIISRSIEWLNKRESCDKRKSDTDKVAFNMLKESLCDISMQNVTDILSIEICGLDAYAWNIIFTVENNPRKAYRLEVPNFRDISFKNLVKTNWGKFTLHMTSIGQLDNTVTNYEWCWSGYDIYSLHKYFDNPNNKDD